MLVIPRTGLALSCAGQPELIVLAANCTDGVCTESMVLRERLYRTFMCAHDTRPVVVPPRSSWLSVPEIARHLGREVTSGVYEILTFDHCLSAMARRGSSPSWDDERARCLPQSLVRRISEDGGGQAFDRLRSDWKATERAGLIRALPVIVMDSFAAKVAVLLAAAAAIMVPWALAWRVRFAPGRTSAIFLVAVAGQVLIALLGRLSIQMSSDIWNGGERGFLLVTIAMMALAAAVVVQVGFLIGRWVFALVAERR